MANKFVSGTLILTLSGFVVKAIGSINWIILSRILGGEGIGIYQMAFPIYLLALEISSAGIPIAISIITAEKVARLDYNPRFPDHALFDGAVSQCPRLFRFPVSHRLSYHPRKPCLLFAHRSGTGHLLYDHHSRIPRVSPGLAADDADGTLTDCRTARPRRGHARICRTAASLRA